LTWPPTTTSNTPSRISKVRNGKVFFVVVLLGFVQRIVFLGFVHCVYLYLSVCLSVSLFVLLPLCNSLLLTL
jgi:hypothetical protein